VISLARRCRRRDDAHRRECSRRSCRGWPWYLHDRRLLVKLTLRLDPVKNENMLFRLLLGFSVTPTALGGRRGMHSGRDGRVVSSRYESVKNIDVRTFHAQSFKK